MCGVSEIDMFLMSGIVQLLAQVIYYERVKGEHASNKDVLAKG